jgi:hypothetical protein
VTKETGDSGINPQVKSVQQRDIKGLESQNRADNDSKRDKRTLGYFYTLARCFFSLGKAAIPQTGKAS